MSLAVDVIFSWPTGVIQAIDSWAKYLGLGTQAEVPWRRATGDRKSCPTGGIQAIGGWARYLGLGAQA